MAEEIGSRGVIRIKNEADRVTVATILYKNGYTVRPVRTKINGKTYEYYVEYTTQSMEPPDQEDDE